MMSKKFSATALLVGTVAISSFASANTDVLSLNPFGALLGGAAAYVPGTGIQLLDEAASFELGATLPKGLPGNGFATIHLVWSDAESASCAVVFSVSGSLSRNGATSQLVPTTWVASGGSTSSVALASFDSPIGFQKLDALLLRIDRAATHELDTCSAVDVHGAALGLTTPATQPKLKFSVPLDLFPPRR